MDVQEAKKMWKEFEKETDRRIHELEADTGLTCFGFTYQYTRAENREGFKQLYTKVGI